MRGMNGWQTGICIACLTLVLAAGCLDNSAETPDVNKTEAAIEIALADPEVQENIPVDTGAYEVVSVGPGGFESAGPEGTVSWRGMEVALRVTNRRLSTMSLWTCRIARLFVNTGSMSRNRCPACRPALP